MQATQSIYGDQLRVVANQPADVIGQIAQRHAAGTISRIRHMLAVAVIAAVIVAFIFV